MVPFVSRTEVKTEVVIGLTIKSLNDDKSRLQLQLQDHQKETRDFWAQFEAMVSLAVGICLRMNEGTLVLLE
ncbi:hypothetical protein V6N13_089834 [Hibiscus sabdariffa]